MKTQISAFRLFIVLSAVSLLVSLVFWFTGQYSLIGIAVITSIILFAFAVNSSQVYKGLAFTVWVLVFAAAAMFYPDILITWGTFKLQDMIVPLIQIILFGMGMTLTFEDFVRIIRMPKAVITGIVLQYAIMPLMGWTFASVFRLPAEVATGLILVGSCPSGAASNVITYLARANVPLSVTLTACTTLISPLMTPLMMKFYAGRYVPVEFFPMMISILKMIIVPLILGLLINRYINKFTVRLVRWLPFLSMLSICLIIGITIALSRNEFFAVGLALFGASVCHNTAGYLLGYWCARAGGMNTQDCRTVAIEVGIQNGGMATGLAFNVLGSKIAAMASAVFGPYSAVSSSILASYWRRGK